jgi:hypothetical protein
MGKTFDSLSKIAYRASLVSAPEAAREYEHEASGQSASPVRDLYAPWQNAFAERLIDRSGVCVDHIIVPGGAHLRRILKSYAKYYSCVRTHDL